MARCTKCGLPGWLARLWFMVPWTNRARAISKAIDERIIEMIIDKAEDKKK